MCEFHDFIKEIGKPSGSGKKIIAVKIKNATPINLNVFTSANILSRRKFFFARSCSL